MSEDETPELETPAAPAKRGRPAGWRKADPRAHRMSLQLTDDELEWLRGRAEHPKRREIDVLRELIAAERVREKRTRRRRVL